jgi:hypothetical protein
MPALNGKTLLTAGCGLFAAGMIAGAALAPRVLAPAPVAVARGDTLATFAPDTILSVTYATRSGITTAQRASRGARFHVQSTFADESPAQRCTAPADLAGHLPRFAEMKARRGLSRDQRDREFPVQLGVLDIRDNVIGEPAVSVLVFSNREQSAVAVALEGYAGEVVLPISELRWLERACDTVALGEEPAAADKPQGLAEPPAEPAPTQLQPQPRDTATALNVTTSAPGQSLPPPAAPSESRR